MRHVYSRFRTLVHPTLDHGDDQDVAQIRHGEREQQDAVVAILV